MPARRYQQTLNRQQEMLLPCRVEEYVSKHNTVRAIDAYVDTLDLQDLGFKHSQPVISPGQPPYNPIAFLKLYLYGYMQSIRSSRKLERETYRNLEVMWLIESLTPTYKSIANFRKDNSRALKAANRDFLLLCKELSLFGGEEVAVDGSFFKGDVSKNNIYTKDQLNKQLDYLNEKITAYQEALEQQDAADNKEGKGSLVEDEQLEEKLKLLQEKQARKKRLQQRLKDSGEKQIAKVDKDARLLSKRGQTIAGYNAQTVVDSKHKLIVAEDVTQDGNDSQQLAPMLEKAQDILDAENSTGLADSGYYSSKQIKIYEDKSIRVYVPIPKYPESAIRQGRFGRDQFQYDGKNDVYLCPQGNTLTPSKNVQFKHNREVIIYRGKTTVCQECPLRLQCITEKSKTREMERWLHEEVIDRHKERMQKSPNRMRKRGSLVEHPFGTLKHRAGINHFLMRGLEKCRGEFSLMVLGYNFTRVLNILGADFLRDYCVQRQENRLKDVKYV